jgi:N-methylhydantoinase A
MTELRCAVDIGGTFTDICILDETAGTIRIAKIASTPDPIDGVMRGLENANVDLRDVTLFSHGTTVATNALITRRLPSTAMVLTEGFRDVIEIRRGTREDLWDTYADVAPPYVRRRDRFVISERTDYQGDVIDPLSEDEARVLAAKLRKRGYQAVAVCFMNAYANPANERRMKEILERELPGVAVSTSSEVLPEIFEHERFSTTVVNAALNPLIGEYALRLSDELEVSGYANDLLMLHSGGGVMTAKTSSRFGARLAGSGIAAGAIASRHIAALCGYENAIGLDMGGTSCDVSLVYGGESRVTQDWHIEYGYPIRFPSIEVLTIGAGGGSLAWIDEAGSLRNGPQSAGAHPGPACYGQGADQPTNTDANLFLGRLGPRLVGGALALDTGAAERAVATHTAEPLGMPVADAAKAIISVANANMADAVRVISIRRGYDPRDFALIAFGGAGALHGAALAKELSIPVVIVPPNPGITSALGCLLVDIRHDLATTYLALAADAEPGAIEAEFRALETEAAERLAAESVSADNMVLQRSIDMRYQGQWRSLGIPVKGRFSSVDEIVAAFHDQHEQQFNYRREEAPVEIYRVNVTAVGVTPKAALAEHPMNGGVLPEPATVREVYFDECEGALETPVYDRDTLPAGIIVDGPAIVEQLDSTTVVPPGVRAEIDRWLNIRMQVSGV